MRAIWSWVRQSLSPKGSLRGYAVLLGIIALVVILALIFLAPPVSQIFSDHDCLQCTNE